jgi:hypothetical protein
VFPVRYELDLYVLFRRNSIVKLFYAIQVCGKRAQEVQITEYIQPTLKFRQTDLSAVGMLR